MLNDEVHIVYSDQGSLGYHPVYYLARLAARLFDARLTVLPSRYATLREKVRGVIGRKGKGSACCLMICPSPNDMNAILYADDIRKQTGQIIAWTFDSFWTDHIPKWANYSTLLDHVLIAEREGIDEWRNKTRVPVEWAPWGTDALSLGSWNSPRDIDLLRVGRQPLEWDDDEENGRRCAQMDICFHGRPPSFSDAEDNERNLMRLMGRSKYLLAFTNRVSPSIQTHPTREYITARWTDALASGAIVAGIPPRTHSVDDLLWPEALLDLGTTDLTQGMRLLKGDLLAWSPERAHFNYLQALARLDWRWRLKTVATLASLKAPRLVAELQQIERLLETSKLANG